MFRCDLCTTFSFSDCQSRRSPLERLGYQDSLAPAHGKGGFGGILKDGPLKAAIDKDFGGLDNLKKRVQRRDTRDPGLGGLNPTATTKRLEIVTTANQDPLLTHVPLIGVSVTWEHAFYLQYLKVKPDYLNAIWDVINFEEAEKRLVEHSKL
ncbi:manganese superoxide dismutase [Mycena olivaceomarginata]|nr:manganese superoxide dismutase [Mycena olivaceomarginata]